jgi:hypothetical protein
MPYSYRNVVSTAHVTMIAPKKLRRVGFLRIRQNARRSPQKVTVRRPPPKVTMSCRPRNGSHKRWRADFTSLSDIAVVEVAGNQPDLSPRSYDALPLPKKLRYVAIPEMAVTKVRDQISNPASMVPVTGHRKSTNALPKKLRCHIRSPRSYDHGRVRELAVPSGYDKETKHTQ